MAENQFIESDIVDLDITKCSQSYVNDFLNSINNETFGRKVNRALSFRKQGNFNKAVLYISEVNRDQVLAIREIQTILDKWGDRRKTEVIFEKFRQTFPFQIGIANGEEVLDILDRIKTAFGDEFPRMIKEMHDHEEKWGSLTEELNFFEERMAGRISDQELDALKEKISIWAGKIVSAKRKVLDQIIHSLADLKVISSPDDKLKIVINLYLILTSNIETLDSRFVKV